MTEEIKNHQHCGIGPNGEHYCMMTGKLTLGGKTMTEEIKKEEVKNEEAIAQAQPQPQPQQQPDLAADAIFNTAVLACFGSGTRADAATRMRVVGLSLLVSAMNEAQLPQSKQAIFNDVVPVLAQAAGVAIQTEDKAEKA